MTSASISAFVSCERDESGELAVRELQRLRAAVSHAWPHPAAFPADVDLIVADFADHIADRLPWMPGEATAALILILPRADGYDRRQVGHCTPDAVIGRPLVAHVFRTTLQVAMQQFQYIRRLRTRISRLDDNLKSSREIERAKAILMNLRQLNEDQAYAFIRKQAMERRTTVAAVAAAIVDGHAVLG
jgi:AmiR/NasT family two-component response regulator